MLYLHGIGHFHPENIITNAFLASLDIGSNEEWIMERVGIRERRTVLSLDYIRETKNCDIRAAAEASEYTHAQMGSLAARMAFERAGLSPGDIGMVISGSSAPQSVSPAEASSVASELGIEAPCFDINSACSTFIMQLNTLFNTKPETLPPYILTVVPESITRVLDYSDRRAAPLFGDGASAAIVSASIPSDKVLLSSLIGSNPFSWDKVMVPRMGHFSQNGNAVQGFAIRKTTDLLRELQDLYPGVGEENFKFVGHQANRGMLHTACERCGISETNHWFNVDEFGNTGGSGASCVLSQHWNDLRPGHHVALVVVGAGLTWARMMLKIQN